MAARLARSLGSLLLLGGFLLQVAAAQEPEYCLDRASEAAYDVCLQDRFDRADGALNLVYQQAMSTIEALAGTTQEVEAQPQAWREALREAQRAWIAFKEAECDGLSPRENWTLWREEHAVLICRITMAEARTALLAERYRLKNPLEHPYDKVVQTDAISGLEKSTLERFGAAVERHDWREVLSFFNEEGYLIQREEFGLEDAQIILETLGITGGPLTEDEPRDAYYAQLNRIAEVVIREATLDDAQGLTVKGVVVVGDGTEYPFSMSWVERMNGGFEAVVPVG